jgi:MarR family transcriptional regulator, organic hydroperoxide resistance regulator
MGTKLINEAWTEIYYYLHYKHEDSLTHQNIRCMQAIKKNEKVTVQYLSKVMNVMHHTTSEHIKRLIQKGFVTKTRSDQDKRIVYVTLTPIGEEVLKRNTELDEEKLQIILEKFDSKEKEQIFKVFSLLSKEVRDTFLT